MRDSKYVVVKMISNDLCAKKFDSYEEALEFVESDDEKAYLVRIEDFCADAYCPITITLEPHT